MSVKCCKFIPRALVALGILIGVFILIPACYAGGAVILVPAEDKDVPEGSQIPEWRSKAIEKKVRAYKVMLKEKYPEQQQEQLPHNKLPKPKVTNEGN